MAANQSLIESLERSPIDGRFFRFSLITCRLHRRKWVEKRCQDSFLGLPLGRRGDWRFRCREITCTQFSSPNGEPRRTQLRTALSSAAVSGLLTRSVHRGERAMGQAESRRGSRSGSSSHRLGEPHLQSSALLTSPARKALRSTYRQTNKE